MAFHPLRDALEQAARRATRHETAFKPQADAAYEKFRSVRDDLERQVRRGDLTVKVARERAAEAAAELRRSLEAEATRLGAAPGTLLDRLIEASESRRRAREHAGAESLQRETNRLLRQSLIEQQIVNRAAEFEGRTAVRAMAGGKPAPTLASLLTFHESATQAGDEAAREWARRQLEAFRPLAADPRDQQRIDLACDRPDSVNPRLVARYVEAIRDADAEALERFVAEAIGARDANACVAAFLHLRDDPAGPASRPLRRMLDGLKDFPDAALEALRSTEAEARALEAEAVRAQVEFVSTLAESEGRFNGLEAPTNDELVRRARVQARPVAAPGEPIGLALHRRGRDPDGSEPDISPAPDDAAEGPA